MNKSLYIFAILLMAWVGSQVSGHSEICQSLEKYFNSFPPGTNDAELLDLVAKSHFAVDRSMSTASMKFLNLDRSTFKSDKEFQEFNTLSFPGVDASYKIDTVCLVIFAGEVYNVIIGVRQMSTNAAPLGSIIDAFDKCYGSATFSVNQNKNGSSAEGDALYMEWSAGPFKLSFDVKSKLENFSLVIAKQKIPGNPLEEIRIKFVVNEESPLSGSLLESIYKELKMYNNVVIADEDAEYVFELIVKEFHLDNGEGSIVAISTDLHIPNRAKSVITLLGSPGIRPVSPNIERNLEVLLKDCRRTIKKNLFVCKQSDVKLSCKRIVLELDEIVTDHQRFIDQIKDSAKP